MTYPASSAARSGVATAAAALLLAGTSMAAGAIGVADAIGDFVPTYTGATGGDLDVVSSFVSYNAATDIFTFSGTMNADIGTTAGAVYVWGVDRGTGTERLVGGTPSTGAGVFFDTVVVLNPNGTGVVNLLNGTTSALTGVEIYGHTIEAEVSAALLPSTGFAKQNYTWNLWPRDGSVAGNAGISDFAPDASNAMVASVPEPETWALMLGGLAGIAALGRRRGARG